ncbi:hypothetical protein LC593_23400 [Nostoc sp. CHAB 5844]|nr:hypothetical protein [Nostoc sp. CHAB 5844]
MSLIDLILGFLLPSDCRDECLGDLYEGYFILRERGTSKFASVLVTIWRTILLILAALQMRWDDIISDKKEVQHTLKAKHPRHHKNTSYHSDSPKSSLQAVYFSTKEGEVRRVTGYDLSAKQHNLLFRLTSKGLKYLLLMLVGFAIVFIFSHAFGAISLAISLVRVAVLLFCLFVIAMIVESWR